MRAVYANARGDIFDSPQLSALGRTGTDATPLRREDWIPLPPSAALVVLPGTRALGLDPADETLKALPESYHAVGALLPQGYTRLYLPAFYKPPGLPPFPLFGYTAVGYSKGTFYAAAMLSDDPTPWDPNQYDAEDVGRRVRESERLFPQNRLFRHLGACALEYECVTSRNTFFGRSEGAVPISPTCNAACVGCISEQPTDSGFPSPQTRLDFRPTVEEMAELMTNHLTEAGRDGIVSFGQGCEGEPALRARDIAEAIRLTRTRIQTGYVNINTNGGLTKALRTIVDAGIDLMRISTVSALPDHYNAYYQPQGYTVEDVAATARYAAARGVIVSLNYLIFPGMADQRDEIDAMAAFIRETGVKLVQLRTLNIDPDYYLDRVPKRPGEPIGIRRMADTLARKCPGLRIGSYTHAPTWFGPDAATGASPGGAARSSRSPAPRLRS